MHILEMNQTNYRNRLAKRNATKIIYKTESCPSTLKFNKESSVLPFELYKLRISSNLCIDFELIFFSMPKIKF